MEKGSAVGTEDSVGRGVSGKVKDCGWGRKVSWRHPNLCWGGPAMKTS